MHLFPDRFRFEPVELRALVEATLSEELGPSRIILLPTPEISSPFATDTGRTAPSASPHFSEAQVLFPPPIDECAFFVINMLVLLFHPPPPISIKIPWCTLF